MSLDARWRLWSVRVEFRGMGTWEQEVVKLVPIRATTWAALAAIGFVVPAGPAVRAITRGARGPQLIPALGQTGAAALAWAVLLTVGLMLDR